MQIFFLTFVLITAAVLLMTVAVLISGRSLKGSCGGPACTCVNEGREIGSCELDENGAPSSEFAPRGSPSLPVAEFKGSSSSQ